MASGNSSRIIQILPALFCIPEAKSYYSFPRSKVISTTCCYIKIFCCATVKHLTPWYKTSVTFSCLCTFQLWNRTKHHFTKIYLHFSNAEKVTNFRSHYTCLIASSFFFVCGLYSFLIDRMKKNTNHTCKLYVFFSMIQRNSPCIAMWDNPQSMQTFLNECCMQGSGVKEAGHHAATHAYFTHFNAFSEKGVEKKKKKLSAWARLDNAIVTHCYQQYPPFEQWYSWHLRSQE